MKWERYGFSLFFGGFIGGLIAFLIWSPLWWVGALTGGMVTYFTYDFVTVRKYWNLVFDRALFVIRCYITDTKNFVKEFVQFMMKADGSVQFYWLTLIGLIISQLHAFPFQEANQEVGTLALIIFFAEMVIVNGMFSLALTTLITAASNRAASKRQSAFWDRECPFDPEDIYGHGYTHGGMSKMVSKYTFLAPKPIMNTLFMRLWYMVLAIYDLARYLTFDMWRDLFFSFIGSLVLIHWLIRLFAYFTVLILSRERLMAATCSVASIATFFICFRNIAPTLASTIFLSAVCGTWSYLLFNMIFSAMKRRNLLLNITPIRPKFPFSS